MRLSSLCGSVDQATSAAATLQQEKISESLTGQRALQFCPRGKRWNRCSWAFAEIKELAPGPNTLRSIQGGDAPEDLGLLAQAQRLFAGEGRRQALRCRRILRQDSLAPDVVWDVETDKVPVPNVQFGGDNVLCANERQKPKCIVEERGAEAAVDTAWVALSIFFEQHEPVKHSAIAVHTVDKIEERWVEAGIHKMASLAAHAADKDVGRVAVTYIVRTGSEMLQQPTEFFFPLAGLCRVRSGRRIGRGIGSRPLGDDALVPAVPKHLHRNASKLGPNRDRALWPRGSGRRWRLQIWRQQQRS